MSTIALIIKQRLKTANKALLACLFLVVTPTIGTSQEFQQIQRPLSQQEVALAKAYHKKLERAYNISPPQKYNKASNYINIGSMYGPKGAYIPSIPNVTAICYGVFLTKSGRILPDPEYTDQTTIKNTTKALERSLELAKLEYLSIKEYNDNIAQARMLEEQKNISYANN